MLSLQGVDVFYGDVQALYGLDMEVREGEIVTLLGANATGKTTTLRAISGLLKISRGTIRFIDARADALEAYQIVEKGLVQVPEGRKLFPHMTVLDNLLLGAYTARARPFVRETLQTVFDLLPVLKERRHQIAGSLSGGEQQMLAIGRGLMSRPRLMMLDEPSLGLAPLLVKKMFEIITAIREQGTTILLVEQNVLQSLAIADRGYVLENGRIVMSADRASLLESPALKKAYLGM